MEATGAEYFGIHVFVGRRVAAGILNMYALPCVDHRISFYRGIRLLFELTFGGGRYILEQSTCSRVRSN